MQLIINGEIKILNNLRTLEELILHLKLKPNCFAVAVNHEFICQSDYQNLILNTDDSIEILTPMQGG